MFGAFIFVSYSSAIQLFTFYNIHNIFETFLASICYNIYEMLVIVFFKYYFFIENTFLNDYICVFLLACCQ